MLNSIYQKINLLAKILNPINGLRISFVEISPDIRAYEALCSNKKRRTAFSVGQLIVKPTSSHH